MENEDANLVIMKIRPWLIAIASILALYTFLTICLIVVVLLVPNRSDQSSSSQTQTQSLPKGLLTSDQREKLFRSFVEVYNARDYHGISMLMSPAFRINNPESDLPETMKRIYLFTEKIEDGAFDHYESQSTLGGIKSWKLFYRIRIDKSKTGTLTLDVYQQGADPFIVNGFKVGD
jgi:hypothetical protein